MQFMKCTFLPSANLMSKKYLQPGQTMTAHRAYALMLVQLISTAADDTAHSV